MNENFIVMDATDDIIIGGFGNLEGNLGLLRYSYEEISQKMKENNNKEDDIRLVNSLLDSIRELQHENQKYKEVIDKLNNLNNRIIEEYKLNYGDNHSKLLLALNTISDILKEVE